eukprot:Gb_08433 [translate_table: standard]
MSRLKPSTPHKHVLAFACIFSNQVPLIHLHRQLTHCSSQIPHHLHAAFYLVMHPEVLYCLSQMLDPFFLLQSPQYQSKDHSWRLQHLKIQNQMCHKSQSISSCLL